jgi:hypothetical protein
VLLKLDPDFPGWSDAQAADAFDCSARGLQYPTTRCRSRDGGFPSSRLRRRSERRSALQRARFACFSPSPPVPAN